MAFNKIKVLETAQKYLNQGKVSQAIDQYQQILRYEPEDQVTLMTIGDLYVRNHDVPTALNYFEKLAQLFSNDGFISKAIAIYKKIAKLAPDEIAPLERLAELYVQQGVMSEARPIYLQLAEAHLKANRSPQAVEVLRKLLELSPDNIRVQVRLADLYDNLGQKKDASSTFLGAAQRMLEKGDLKEAQRLAERAIQSDPKSPGGLILKARILDESGKSAEAIQMLEGAPASDETSTLLTEIYLKSGDAEKAVEMGRKAIGRGTSHFGVAYNVANALIAAGEADRGIQLLGEVVNPALDAGDTERLLQMLAVASSNASDRLEPLEWQADAYRRTGDMFHLPEALLAIARTASSTGNLDRAKTTYEELLQNDPENAGFRQALAQVCEKLGVEAPAHVEAEAPPQVEPTESEPVAVETQLDEETEKYVHQALTDVDLFSSYGLTQKGIDLLETVLQRAPGHTGALEKLLDLHLGAGNERRTAELAAQLEQIHTDRGDSAGAERFAELRRRFERAAGRTEAAAAEPPPTEFAIPVEASAAEEAPAEVPVAETTAPPGEEAEVHEVDLSEEWAAMTEEAATEETAPAEAPAEVEAQPEEAPPAEPAAVEVEPAQEVEPEPVEAEAAATEEAVAYEFSADEAVELKAEPEPVEAVEPPQEPEATPVEAEPVPVEAEAAPTEETGGSQVFAELSEEVAQTETVEVVGAEEPAAMTSDQFLSELGAEMSDFQVAAPAAEPAPKAAAKAAAGGEAPVRGRKQTDQLREVFDEFKADMGEMGEADAEAEDLETHYNLGIAYREMGLLEEAIGEFQKVAQAIKSGRPFRYAMQCYTLLGLSFMDKSQPKIAAIWYEQALKTPDLDPESILAVRYDLGVAHELAGDNRAALDSFSQVYAMNIDYRDVAERIAALNKQS